MRYAGTEDIVGGTVIMADFDEMVVEKDGVRYKVIVEEEPYWNSMNDCNCGCSSYGPSHLRTYIESS